MKNQEIQDLLKVPKIVDGGVKKSADQRGSVGWNFKATSYPSLETRFSIFLRQNTEFIENFSIGLDYNAPDGSDLRLVRFNGTHPHRNHVRDHASFDDFHVHLATEEAINLGYKPEDFAFVAEHRTFEEALVAFWTYVNLRGNPVSYFSFLSNARQLTIGLGTNPRPED